MTAPARDGRDEPVCDWIRTNRNLDSISCSLCVTDKDMSFLKFVTYVDGIGTRNLKLMQNVEFKSFGKCLMPQQQEELFFSHQLLAKKKKLYSTYMKKPVGVWHYGYSILRMIGGDRPDRCDSMEWARFENNGELLKTEVSENTLTELLAFNLDPQTLQPIEFRRHHKTRKLMQTVTDRLFPDAVLVTKRS